MSDFPLFDDTIKELMKAAKKDDIITPEELDIIEQVKVDAEAYSVILKEAFMDGKVTEEEERKLKELKQAIIDRAEIIAKVDGHFTPNEREMIKKLSEIIKERYI